MQKQKLTSIGDKYGRLTILSDPIAVQKKNRKKYYLDCMCDCGNKTRVLENNIRRKVSLSCGCLQKDTAAKLKYKHGMSECREYQIWAGMKDRCNNPNNSSYHNYGKRNISYDTKWETFEGFYKDMGKCPDDLTLERINNNKNYSKENCKWATTAEQGKNTRSCKDKKVNKKLLRAAIKDLEANVLTHKEIATKYSISTVLVSSISFANKTYEIIKEIKEE